MSALSAASAAGPARPMRFRDLTAAERMKITTLPATWIALTVTFGANTLLGVIVVTDAVRFGSQDGQVPIAELGTLMFSPAYAFLAIAVFAAGSEHRGGQLRVSLVAVPDRSRLFAAKLTVSATVGIVAATAAVLPGYVVRHAPAIRAGERAAGDVVGGFLAVLAAYVLLGLVGHGFAVLAKSVVTPIATLFITPVLVSPAFRGDLPHVVKFLPHEAALSLLGTPADPVTALTPSAGFLVLALWAAVFITTAWHVFVRRDS
ncbi:hypothetical protein P9869_14150 [Streptomyces ossamyceticus]|nr:hypothetical protein [Streptomyces ossamyceticus]